MLAAAEAGGGTPRFGDGGDATATMPMSRVMTREIAGARLADCSFACQVVAGGRSVEERRDLRQCGTLPGWFFNELEREANARRRRQRALRD